jgi:hypothetical protein
MAELIYRSVAHDGTRQAYSRKKHDLVYRGVRHDGFGTPETVSPRTATMVYRGVRHTAAVSSNEAGVTRFRQPRHPEAQTGPVAVGKDRVAATV